MLTLTGIAVVTVIVFGERPTILADIVLADIVHLDAHIGIAILELGHKGFLILLKYGTRGGEQHTKGYRKNTPRGDTLNLYHLLAKQEIGGAQQSEEQRNNIGSENTWRVGLDAIKAQTLKSEGQFHGIRSHASGDNLDSEHNHWHSHKHTNGYGNASYNL